MGTTGRPVPLRGTGSLLLLLGFELAAVVGLHWLGRVEGLRIGWEHPVPWLVSSPVQDVLGALLRTVGPWPRPTGCWPRPSSTCRPA